MHASHKQNKKIENIEQSPIQNQLNELRQSACAGAARVLLPGRHDVIEEIASWSLLEFARRLGRVENGPIKNPKSYIYRMAKSQALHWLEWEEKLFPLNRLPGEGEEDGAGSIESIVEPSIAEPNLISREQLLDREQLLENLPPLFERFKNNVIGHLPEEHRRFFQEYFIKKQPEDKLSELFDIKEKSLHQRWHRLIAALHDDLVHELKSWPLGEELYFDVLNDPERINEFLCLLRLYLEQGFEAVRELADSISG